MPWSEAPEPSPIRHLYLHAPFCPRRCSYCDFPVTTAERAPTGAWLSALSAEVALLEAEGRFFLDQQLDTLYVGGGTPSFLGPDAMGSIPRLLGQERLTAPRLEWTVEANPESFTRALALSWAQAGVNRVSLGVQSFQPPVLRWLNRSHGPEEAHGAIQAARRGGIENISLDLMFGLPGAVKRDWTRDLDRALAAEVPHLSLYGLSVEKGTPLALDMELGKLPRPDEEEYREEFLEASERLVSEGYRHYEVSNFALPGYESRHNLAYWERRPYLGLGNGAHSYQPPRRSWNLRGWTEYQRACEAGDSPREGEEELTTKDVRLEGLWLGLRTDRGMNTRDWRGKAVDLVTSWVSEGYARHEKGTVRLTPSGWLLLDHLVVKLDQTLG
ncbi:MAG: radical SAM family heme chaperone HemW [Gemmatimonadota bacterium]